MSKIVRTFYLHGNDESFYEELSDVEFPNEEAEYMAANWAYEIEFKVEIDTETGASRVLALKEGNSWRDVK